MNTWSAPTTSSIGVLLLRLSIADTRKKNSECAFFSKASLIFCFVATALLFSPCLRAQEPHTAPMVVRVAKVNGRASYTVDSQPVSDLLRAPNQVADPHGTNQPVVVQLDSRLPAAELWNVDGVAGRAQLSNLRFFIVFKETGMMSEIKRLPAVPVSASTHGN
jgi:hypothetical protein